MKTLIAVFTVVFAILPAPYSARPVEPVEAGNDNKINFEILNGGSAYQGDTLAIKISDNSVITKFGVDALGQLYRFNAQGVAFIGISADQKPGNYDLVLVDLDNKEALWQYELFCGCCDCKTIEVLPNNFGEERMKKFTPTEKQKKQRIREAETMQAAYKTADPAQNYISGKFVSPVAEKDIGKITITDPFGIWRVYSKDKKDRDWHRGVDLRTGEKAPILAINSGIVILAAKDFLLEGNMVVVYHGLGIFSLYIHLSEIKVEQDQKIETGQMVGLSGRTGARTTGPHLHLGLKINGATVDPLKFIETANKDLN